MEAYGSLALEDISEVGASAPVPSSSQPKKQNKNLQWVLLEEDLVISPKRGLPVQFLKGPGMVLGYLSQNYFTILYLYTE